MDRNAEPHYSAEQARVVYVGPFLFPDGGAAARRILGNAQALIEAGCDVLVGSGQGIPSERLDEILQSRLQVESLGERTSEHLPVFLKRLAYSGMGRKTRNWLDGLSRRPDAVILYSGYTPYLLHLLPWSRRTGTPLIFDAVEWYDPPNFIWGLLSPYQWNIEAAMRFLAPKVDGVIAISRYLENHFEGHGVRTVRIPPTLDTTVVAAGMPSSNERLVLSYAGNPGLKDLFDDYLETVLRLDREGRHVGLRVAGVPPGRLMQFPAIKKRGLTALPGCIDCVGPVSHDQALELVRGSDFSLLTRPRARNTEAGFPTKAVESLAVGTPVILNITSDLGEYIHDGEEGLVCPDQSLGSLMGAVERALSMTKGQRIEMRGAARRRAEASFDYRNYVEVLGAFIKGLQN